MYQGQTLLTGPPRKSHFMLVIRAPFWGWQVHLHVKAQYFSTFFQLYKEISVKL